MFYSIKDLKKLVKSLSGAEKRHFSLFSSAFAASRKEPVYLRLFRVLTRPGSELSEFSEKGDFPEYTTIKERLFRNILKSLRLFHQEKSVEISIQNYLSDIEILYGRSLPEQSLYLLQKAYKNAVTYEKFGLLLQILEWEKKLNIVLDNPTRTIKDIAAEEEIVLQRLLQIMQLKNIYGKAKDMKKQHGNIKGKIIKELDLEILKAKEMIPYEECASQKARFYFNFIHALYYWMTFNYKKAYQYSKALLTSQIQVILPGDYMDGILEHATICMNTGKFNEALDILELAQKSMREQKLNYLPAFSVKLFFYTAGYHSVIYNYMGDRAQLAAAVSRVENGLNLYEKSMPLEARYVTNANLMNAYLGLDDGKKVDELWEVLFHKTSKGMRRDIYDDLYLFRLFRLLQQKVYAVLPAMALSAYRHYRQLRDNPLHFDLELKITGILLKEHDYENPRIRNEVLHEIKGILIHHISNLKGANNFQEHYSLYVIWTDSMLKEQPFHEAAACWYKAYINGNREQPEE